MRKLLLIFFTAIGIANAQTTYHVAKTGDDHNPGTSTRPLKTISAAASLAQPGDVITVHQGIYRERVDPPRGGTSESKRITYQAAKGEHVEIRGSEVVNTWTRQPDGTWLLELPDSFFGDYNPFKDLIYGDWFFNGGRAMHTGEVFLEGKQLYEVFTRGQFDHPAKAVFPHGMDSTQALTTAYRWFTYASNGKTVIMAYFGDTDPNKATVEVTVRPSCFYPSVTGRNYITVRGFTMRQAATQWAAPTAEQIGLIGTNWSKGWIIEDNVISDSKCVGITLGKDRASGQNVWSKDLDQDGAVLYSDMVHRVIAEGWSKATIGSHIVRHNTIYNCFEAGICGSFGAAFSRIYDNHIYNIHTYRPCWGAEIAGIKLHAAVDAVIRHNRIHNAFQGIWLDWMAQGTVVDANLLYNNDYPDFYVEVSHGPYRFENNLSLSSYSLRDMSEGGSYSSNLIVGEVARCPQDRVTPIFKPHTTQWAGAADIKGGNNRFYNNIFLGAPVPYQIVPNFRDEAVDSISGYGLALYDSCYFPNYASGNVYLNGARPFPAEKNPRVVGGDLSWSIIETTRQVMFRWGDTTVCVWPATFRPSAAAVKK